MTSVFEGLAGVARQAVAAVNAAEATYRPMRRTSPDGPYEVDPDRSVVVLAAAIFHQKAEDVALGDQRQVGYARQPHVSAALTVSLSLAELGFDPVEGDRVERGRDLFQVEAPEPDGLGNVDVTLNKVSS